MVTLDELARFALDLPGVAEVDRRGGRAWAVADKHFAWERPFTKADLKRFGDTPIPGGPVVGLVTDGLDDKQALLAAHPGHLFTIPHFDGYPALLMDLEKASVIDVTEALLDAWLVRAPTELAERHLGGR